MASVRIAYKSDIDAIVNFNIEGAKESAGHMLSYESVRDGVAYSLRAPNDFYLLCEEEGKIVGQLRVHQHWYDWYDQTFWWIEHVYVPPAHRRKGYAKMLVDEVRRRAKEKREIKALLLVVNPKNNPAVRLYEKLEFELHPNKVMADFVGPIGKLPTP
jgi:ribosomal protein S18 acetylase RimI-like enzyme